MNVDVGDRVTTPHHGPGVIVNIERFDKWGKPYYETDRQNQVPTDLNRWGVKLDSAGYKHFKDGVAYFMSKELKHES